MTTRSMAVPHVSKPEDQTHGGTIEFIYDPQSSTEEAEAEDNLLNWVTTLWCVAKHDPSHRLRVWALGKLAELYWPMEPGASA